MIDRTYAFIVVSLFFNLFHSGIYAQSKVWVAPNNVFSVDVPVELKLVDAELTDNDPEGYEKSSLFNGANKSLNFKVVIIELREKDAKSRTEDKLAGLEFVLGGDDDHEFSAEFLKIQGLNSKEIVYKNQNNKGLMIDAGDKIYILGVTTKNRKDLNSKLANRFFKSFCLIKTGK